jgi:hypothetical protein
MLIPEGKVDLVAAAVCATMTRAGLSLYPFLEARLETESRGFVFTRVNTIVRLHRHSKNPAFAEDVQAYLQAQKALR